MSFDKYYSIIRHTKFPNKVQVGFSTFNLFSVSSKKMQNKSDKDKRGSI